MSNIKDVAKLAGVSISTVSRTLSGKIFVEESTKQKVLAAVNELHYKPNIMAQGLREGKTHTLAFLVPDINSFFYPAIMNSVEKYASLQGYSLMLCNNNKSIRQEKQNLGMLLQRQVDGILCMSVEDKVEHLVKAQAESDIPIVLINRFSEQPISSIMADNYYGGYLMAKYLLDHGHRRIGCMFESFTQERYRARYAACQQALNEYGIKDNEKFFSGNIGSIEAAHDQTIKWLKRKDRPTAILTAIDTLALGIYSGIRESGLTIPDDVSVIGFENIFITKYMSPPLTTHNFPTDLLAQEAINCLLGQINGGWKDHIQKKIFQGSLVIRNSVKKITP